MIALIYVVAGFALLALVMTTIPRIVVGVICALPAMFLAGIPMDSTPAFVETVGTIAFAIGFIFGGSKSDHGFIWLDFDGD